MKRNDPALLAAEAEAEAARKRLLNTLQATQTRLTPSAIKQEATDRAVDHALGSIDQARLFAQSHPMQIVGLAATVGLFAARRPLTAVLKSAALGAGRYAFSRLAQKIRR